MLKTLFFSIFFAFANICAAQAPDIEWQNSLGGTDDDFGWFIEPSPDGGYIVSGHSYSMDGDLTINNGGRDFWMIKLDTTGNMVWQNTLGGSGNESARSFQSTADGGYIVAGASDSNDGDVTGNHGDYDFWVVKMDASRNIIWQKSYGGTLEDAATSVQQTSDDGYIVAGYSKSDDGDVIGHHGSGSGDVWVLKLDASGNITWQSTLGGTGIDYGYSVQETIDGDYIVTGASNSSDGDVTGNHGDFDLWTIKLDPSGSILWQKSLGGSAEDWGYSGRQDSDGGYFVGGYSFSSDGDVSNNHGESDIWVVKLNSAGEILWQNSIGGSSNEYTWSVEQNENDEYVIAGYSNSSDGDVSGNHGDFDYWIVQLDGSGNIDWQKSYGGSGEEKSRSIKQTTEGDYIVAGFSFSNDGDVSGSHGDRDLWVVKLDSQPTGIADKKALSFSIYPNPARESVSIGNAPTGATIKIIDVSGKLIYTGIIKGAFQTVNTSKFADSVYLIQIEKDNLVGQEKLIINN